VGCHSALATASDIKRTQVTPSTGGTPRTVTSRLTDISPWSAPLPALDHELSDGVVVVLDDDISSFEGAWAASTDTSPSWASSRRSLEPL
jgi:hypothetical protein